MQQNTYQNCIALFFFFEEMEKFGLQMLKGSQLA